MTAAATVLALTWLGVTAYALLGGADFGGGFWDLVAGTARGGAEQRALIEHSIAPVWEANHTWLIFVLVILWTGFPLVFASVASTLVIPFTLAALGIIARGSAFAFRKSVPMPAWQQVFGAAFALSSVMTPFFLGTIAGAVASGRVPPGNARGDLVGSWWNPTSVLGGVLAVGVCAYIAAVFLTVDARRTGAQELAEAFRRRAIVTALVVGAVALAGIAVLHADAPELFTGLTGRALPLIVLSALAGLASLVLLVVRRYRAVRVTAAVAVAAVVWGWGAAQYPVLLEPDVTLSDAAAPPAVMSALLVTIIAGSALLLPSLWLLFVLFPRQAEEPGR
ncbi:MAG: terminal oxidase subunit [Frankiales bacterium]|jgi:cytochrome d ubiquinol oxidase subunit II|nr:terminal oxidase subunit [Frankiales bacterium]